jgi:predicted nucleic-acid-binding protein
VIAIDTNVLLRYLLQDDAIQSAKANKLVAGHKTILVTDIVLSETIWTLKGKKYKLPKEQLLHVIEQLFKEPNLVFEEGQVVWRAFNDFRVNKPVKVGSKKKDIDFADALILEKSQFLASQKKAVFHGMYSFDVAAQQLENINKP